MPSGKYHRFGPAEAGKTAYSRFERREGTW